MTDPIKDRSSTDQEPVATRRVPRSSSTKVERTGKSAGAVPAPKTSKMEGKARHQIPQSIRTLVEAISWWIPVCKRLNIRHVEMAHLLRIKLDDGRGRPIGETKQPKFKEKLDRMKTLQRLLRVYTATLEIAFLDAVTIPSGARKCRIKATPDVVSYVGCLCVMSKLVGTALTYGMPRALSLTKAWAFSAESVAVGAPGGTKADRTNNIEFYFPAPKISHPVREGSRNGGESAVVEGGGEAMSRSPRGPKPRHSPTRTPVIENNDRGVSGFSASAAETQPQHTGLIGSDSPLFGQEGDNGAATGIGRREGASDSKETDPLLPAVTSAGQAQSGEPGTRPEGRAQQLPKAERLVPVAPNPIWPNRNPRPKKGETKTEYGRALKLELRHRQSMSIFASIKRALDARFLTKHADLVSLLEYVERMTDGSTAANNDEELLSALGQFAEDWAYRGQARAGGIEESSSVNDNACLFQSKSTGGSRAYMQGVTDGDHPLLPAGVAGQADLNPGPFYGRTNGQYDLYSGQDMTASMGSWSPTRGVHIPYEGGMSDDAPYWADARALRDHTVVIYDVNGVPPTFEEGIMVDAGQKARRLNWMPGKFFLPVDAPDGITDMPGWRSDFGPDVKRTEGGTRRNLQKVAEFAQYCYSTSALAKACQDRKAVARSYGDLSGGIRTVPVPIRERGLKVRVASIYDAAIVIVAQRFNKSLRKMLTCDRAHFEDGKSNLEDMLGKGSADRWLFSSDLSVASDYMQHAANRAMVRGIFRGARRSVEDACRARWKRPARARTSAEELWFNEDVEQTLVDSVGVHRIKLQGGAWEKLKESHPALSGRVEALIRKGGDREGGLTAQGAPMGLGTTWPLLALIHRFCTWYKISRYDRERVALKGDDALLHFTEASFLQYTNNLGNLGLKINLTKSHKSRTGGVFCGKYVYLKEATENVIPGLEIDGKPAVVKTYHKVQKISTIKMSAVLMARRAGEREEAQKVPLAVALGPALRSEFVGLSKEVKKRTMKTVRWFHASVLARMRKTGVPIYWPRQLGGFDLPGKPTATDEWRKASAAYMSGTVGKSGNPEGWGTLLTLSPATELHEHAQKMVQHLLDESSEVRVVRRGKGGTVREAVVEGGKVLRREQNRKWSPFGGERSRKESNVPEWEPTRSVLSKESDPEPKIAVARHPGGLAKRVGANLPHHLYMIRRPGVPYPVSSDDAVQERASEDSESTRVVVSTDIIHVAPDELESKLAGHFDVWVGMPERHFRTACTTAFEALLRRTPLYKSVPPKVEPNKSDPGSLMKRARRVTEVFHKLRKLRPSVKPVSAARVHELVKARREYGERLIGLDACAAICASLGVKFRTVLTDLQNNAGRPPEWCRLEDPVATINREWDESLEDDIDPLIRLYTVEHEKVREFLITNNFKRTGKWNVIDMTTEPPRPEPESGAGLAL